MQFFFNFTKKGLYKSAAGNYIVEGYFGDYDPEKYPDYRKYIGLSYGVYSAECKNYAYFSCVATDIYNTNWKRLASTYVFD